MKLLLPFIVIFLLNSVVFAQDFYSLGKSAYIKGDYQSAAKYFKAKLASSPKNINCKYYYAQALIGCNDLQNALIQYKEIVALSPNSNAGKLAKIGILQINQYALKQNEVIGDNYIKDVMENGKYYRFSTMPVNVYIEPTVYKVSVQNAFKTWQNATYNRVSFNFVNDEKNAQIRVYFKPALNQSYAALENSEFITGFSKPYYQNGFIYKSDVFLLQKNPLTGKILPKEEVYTTALHEIGHAIGLRGHSDKPSDVMSSRRSSLRNLSERDKNTVLLLYR